MESKHMLAFPIRYFPESLVWRMGGKEEIYWVLCQAGEFSSRTGMSGKAYTTQNDQETDSEPSR